MAVVKDLTEEISESEQMAVFSTFSFWKYFASFLRVE